MSGPLKYCKYILGAFLLALLCPRRAVASAAARLSSSSDGTDVVPPGECSSTGEEGHVLCEASRRRDDSINQVIAEDETVRTGQDSTPPSADRAGDVWAAAYNQWVEGRGKANGEKLPKNVARALDEARKRVGAKVDDKEENTADSFEMPDLDDDELKRITTAAHTLANKTLAAEEVKMVLDTIDALCGSGDNGRQLEAAGGLPDILRNVFHVDADIAIMALKVLATCSQNNPPVFEAAVSKHAAIDTLLDVAKGAEETLGLRAAAMRALVALSVASEASSKFAERGNEFIEVVMQAVGADVSNREGRRCVTRGYALVEQCLIVDLGRWKTGFGKAGLERTATAALKSEDIDIREGAARVLKLLR